MKNTGNIGVAILGGTGYGAGELLRLFAVHPNVEVVSVTTTSQLGKNISEAHPQLSHFYENLCFTSEVDFNKLDQFQEKFIFAALPHGTSAEAIEKLLGKNTSKNLKVIDLSGDFRLKNQIERQKHYPEADVQESLREEFVYGLPELNKALISKARYISNPGCLSSTCALAVLPLIDHDFKGQIVFDAKTGTSGAGKSLQDALHHPTRNSNLNAYKILQHRHEPEIRETLGDIPAERIETIFVPHLLPISRGIFASAYLTLEKNYSNDELQEKYCEYYKDSPFIRIKNTSPELANVIGTNFCDISVFARGKQIVAFATLDNLVKGMAGLAIENMNIMAGLSQETGLLTPGFGIV